MTGATGIGPADAPSQLPPPPRWFWSLAFVVVAAWLPIDPFWASDDFFALYYAQDFANVLRDFTGPQYGAADVFFFWRPLITLSHWLDVQIGGGEPYWAHLFNVLVHAANALLCACLWRRLLPDRRAWAAGLLYALLPGHIGSLGWAAGRTDAIAALTGMGTALLLLRWCEGSVRTRLPALAVFATGLLCKETVLSVPGLAALLAFAHRDGNAKARIRAAVIAVWPFAAMLVVYFAARYLALGRFGGGYDAASFAPLVMAQGLSTYVLDLLDPLRWTTASDVLPPVLVTARWLPWLGALPMVAAALWLLLRRERRRATLLAIAWFLLASVPLASFLNATDNHHNLRYFALAVPALTGLLAAGGALPTLLALLVFVPAMAQMRIEQWRADTESAHMHRQLLQQFAAPPKGPWFVAGLPHVSPTGMALQYHFGVDRVLLPPFGPGGERLYAHRSIADAPGTVQLLDDEALPLAIPGTTTWMFRGPDLLTTLPLRPLPALPLRCDPVVDCTTKHLQQIATGAATTRIVTPGLRAGAMRLSFFTAGGYLGAVVDNHAPAGAADGEIDLLQFFRTANWATGRRLIDALEVATIVDLDTTFPVLIEAGESRNGVFRPTHRARELVPFRFDRGLAALLRTMRQ